VRWLEASALVLAAVAGLWAALRFRSRNNPNSTAELVGWWFLASMGALIVVGAWVGLLLELRAGR
jgi:hypothetical protein